MGSPIAEHLPINTIGMLEAKGVRTQAVPSVGTRRINGTYTAQTVGTVEPFSEISAIIGGPVNIDRVLLRTKGMIQDPAEVQLSGKADAIAYDFNDAFINNDETVNKDMFVGIKKRIQDTAGTLNEYEAGGQLIAARNPAAATEGLNPKANDASRSAFLDYVNALIRKMPKNNKPGVRALYMNEDLYDIFTSVARDLKLLKTIEDQYDREVETYRGVRLYDIGEKSDQTTKIITNTETGGSAGGSSDCTSLYLVQYGDDYVQGFQLEPFNAWYVGAVVAELGTVMEQWMTEWVMGLFIPNKRSMARLSGIRIV